PPNSNRTCCRVIAALSADPRMRTCKTPLTPGGTVAGRICTSKTQLQDDSAASNFRGEDPPLDIGIDSARSPLPIEPNDKVHSLPSPRSHCLGDKLRQTTRACPVDLRRRRSRRALDHS